MNPFAPPSPFNAAVNAGRRNPFVLLMAGFAIGQLVATGWKAPMFLVFARFGEPAIAPLLAALVASLLLGGAVHQMVFRPARGAWLFAGAAMLFALALLWIVLGEVSYSTLARNTLLPDFAAGVAGSVLGFGLALRIRSEVEVE